MAPGRQLKLTSRIAATAERIRQVSHFQHGCVVVNSYKRSPYVKESSDISKCWCFSRCSAPETRPTESDRDAIAESAGERVILASVYDTLERLERKGLVHIELRPADPRARRRRRRYCHQQDGSREVRAAKKALTVLWRAYRSTRDEHDHD